MVYSSSYFFKTLDELVYQDIENYFVEEKEESTRIEYKSYSSLYGNFDKNLEGIIRSICALLNSEGGIVIWGAPEGRLAQKGNNKIYQGNLSPLSETKEKDWIINKVSDSITPLPIGISVKILQQGDEHKFVYIFEIQQSTYSPHQFKNTYYARLDGQTKPAPHYLIDALFKKIKYPNIEGFIKFDKITNDGTNYNLYVSIIIFNFSFLQNEENVSYNLTCSHGVFKNAGKPFIENNYESNGTRLVFENRINVLHYGQPILHTDCIELNKTELLRSETRDFQLFLTFGGKYSPLKMSYYRLNFDKLDLDQLDNINYLIAELQENRLLMDKHSDFGFTKEDILRRILER